MKLPSQQLLPQHHHCLSRILPCCLQQKRPPSPKNQNITALNTPHCFPHSGPDTELVIPEPLSAGNNPPEHLPGSSAGAQPGPCPGSPLSRSHPAAGPLRAPPPQPRLRHQAAGSGLRGPYPGKAPPCRDDSAAAAGPAAPRPPGPARRR